jgi:hypothetical protein
LIFGLQARPRMDREPAGAYGPYPGGHGYMKNLIFGGRGKLATWR